MARKSTKSAAGVAEWSESELARKRLAEAGRTVLANMRSDKALIAWAEAEGLYVRIDRRTAWGNPYELGEDGDRQTVIESYRLYFQRKYGLHERLEELRGKVLGCWCFPDQCHGSVLLDLLQELPHEHPACGGLCSPRKNSA